MTYNDPDALQDKFRVIGEQYTDNEIQDELDRANRKLQGRMGGEVVETKRAETNNQEEFTVGFNELETLNHVMIARDNEYIDPTNYTFDSSTGTITFNDKYAEDNIYRGLNLKFFYEPTRFKDLELWYAVKSIATSTAIQNRDGESSIDIETVDETIKQIENEVKSKSGNRLIKDHGNRFPATQH